ncbi:PREDICTED: transcription factor TGA2-like [Tarenaya hassleriana]|uniref:transcription factor TGA2-like n=1 Tax=Tarenaya hassleriana TaxID=28532 RepID=UPI00053C9117|nr:PREDICTED: transcription factor TGA2-like [Tarenaya hassleriana]
MASSEFAEFVGEWILRQEGFHDELLAAKEHAGEEGFCDRDDLIARVIRHYKEYFERKAVVRENDCFALLSPTWFSRLEICFLWVAGFKPGLGIGIVKDAVGGLTNEQMDKMDMLELETIVAETTIEHRLAEIQRSAAALRAIRRQSREDNMAAQADVDWIATAMKGVVAAADALRMRTAIKIVGILQTAQKIEFLTAAATLYKKIRVRGSQRGGDASTSMQR